MVVKCGVILLWLNLCLQDSRDGEYHLQERSKSACMKEEMCSYIVLLGSSRDCIKVSFVAPIIPTYITNSWWYM